MCMCFVCFSLFFNILFKFGGLYIHVSVVLAVLELEFVLFSFKNEGHAFLHLFSTASAVSAVFKPNICFDLVRQSPWQENPQFQK